jgi:type II secretory pathway pseudopilin PulG
MHALSSDRGFTLFETLVATSILITTLAGVAQLFVLGTHLTRQASASGLALVAAQDKLESLRGQAFTYDADGMAVTAAALQPSPSAALGEDVEPYVDWLDLEGRPQEDADNAVLTRRWRVSSLGATTPDAIAIEVCVFRVPAAADPRGADACLSTIRTRQP